MSFPIIQLEHHSEIQVLGSMVQERCDAFAQQLDALLKESDLKRVLLINLEEMDYISSSGLIPLINVFNQCNAKGVALGIFGLQANIAHLFEVTGMAVYLRIFETRDQALQALLGAS